MLTARVVTVEELGRRAFALAIHQFCPGLFPDAGDVEFKKGDAIHNCALETNSGFVIKGCFYHKEGEISANGHTCIGSVADAHSSQFFVLDPPFFFRPADIEADYRVMRKSRTKPWIRQRIISFILRLNPDPIQLN